MQQFLWRLLRLQADGHREDIFTREDISLMMNSNLTLVGFIGRRDAETKTLKSGRQVNKFSVATKES